MEYQFTSAKHGENTFFSGKASSHDEVWEVLIFIGEEDMGRKAEDPIIQMLLQLTTIEFLHTRLVACTFNIHPSDLVVCINQAQEDYGKESPAILEQITRSRAPQA